MTGNNRVGFRPRCRSILAALPLLLCLLFGCKSTNSIEHPYRIESDYSVADPQFRRTIGNLLGPSMIEGNATTTLLNGKEIFPAMLKAIASAHKTLTLETYVYWSGDVGRKFTDALSERAASGVKVSVLIDSVGSDRINDKYISQMKKAGVRFYEYHPLKWYDLTSAQKLNNRTHRKLLVVDGTVGFTGGAGIADEWDGDADAPKHWRDTHYRVEGPVVAQLQAAFADNWMETTGQVLQGDDYFPRLQPAGTQIEQVFKSSSGGGSESMELMYLLSMACSRHNIRLASAYFVPDHLTIQTLVEARKRGVRVQIIVPGKRIDEKVVRTASRARWGEMLRAGVEIYEYEPTMYHCKLMIVDDLWVSIGSANLDNRSFRLNDEANLNVLDQTFAAEQIRVFEQDLGKCKRITYEQWRRRPLHEKLMDELTTIFAPLM